MFIAKTLSFYKRPEVQEEIVRVSKGREVAVKYGERGFGKRPDVLQYPTDVLEFAKKRATSFHVSEERWRNPLQLETEMHRKEQDELRTGWDLVLDIDCHFLEYSKVAAHFVVKTLKKFGIKSVTAKFSGNKGFHIAVPFEAFPEEIHGTPTAELFPEAPKRIALYVSSRIKGPLRKTILKKHSLPKIVEKTGLKRSELVTKAEKKDELGNVLRVDTLNIDKFLEIDTVLISPRHLFRAPYSFHEKSGLVSVPVNPDKVMGFDKSMAEHDKVKFEHKFLERSVEKGEARTLLIQAFDFQLPEQEEKKVKKRDYELPEEAIPEEFFPPSIKKGLEGLKDGRKRFMFILTNFLSTVGWTKPKIEERVWEWNKQNPQPLKDALVKTHLRYVRTGKDAVPPPNYSTNIYRDLGIQGGDRLAKKYKNPVKYAKVLFEMNNEKKKSRKLTPEQKEMRRKYRERLKKEKSPE